MESGTATLKALESVLTTASALKGIGIPTQACSSTTTSYSLTPTVADSRETSIFAPRSTRTALMKICTRFPIRSSLHSPILLLTTRIAWSSTLPSVLPHNPRSLWTRRSYMSFTSKALPRRCRRFPRTFAAPTQDSLTPLQCAISRSLASLPSSYFQSTQSLMSLSSLNADSQTIGDTRRCHSLAPSLPMPARLPVHADLRQ